MPKMYCNNTDKRRLKMTVYIICFWVCFMHASFVFKGEGFAAENYTTEVVGNSSAVHILPPVLYSLQLNTYVYESAAQRAYESLPVELSAEGFVYLTDSGYYTLRLGQAFSRSGLDSLEEKLLEAGYSGYRFVRTDPAKLALADYEVVQTPEPAPIIQPDPSPEEPSDRDDHKPIVEAGSYEDAFTEPYVLPAGKNSFSLSLQQAVRMAIDRNSDIRIASFLSSIAEEEKKSTRTVYDPTLVVENNISRIDRPIQSKLDIGTEPEALLEDRWDFRAGVRQPLPTGGTFSLSVIDVDHLDSSSDLVIPNPQYTSRLTLEFKQALLKEFGDRTNRSAMEIADLNLNISSMEFQKTMANVIREVGTYYWRLVYYDRYIKVSRKYMQDAEDVYQKLLYREESGLADMLDVDRALASLQDRKAILIKANTDYKLAMDQLKFLLGFASDSEREHAVIIPTEEFLVRKVDLDSSPLLEEALMRRPEHIIAKDRVSAVEIQKKLAEHLKLPTLNAKAMYAFNSLEEGLGSAIEDTYLSDHGSWALGLEFEWPIGGRKADADYLKVVHEEKQAKAELAKTLEEITFQINTSVTEIGQSLKEIQAAEESKKANQRLLSRENSRFEIKKVNIHTLLDAQDDYYFAVRTYIRAISSFNISLLKLKWAKGTILEDYGIIRDI